MRHACTALALSTLLWAWGCDSSSPGVVGAPACSGYAPWETSDYVLPYPVGRAYFVLQGNCGSFSHFPGSQIAYDYDFPMPIGTVVTAARGGDVVAVTEEYQDYDNERGHENGVIVQHADGTYARYVHFTQDGATVEEGDTVAPGDTLGLSGNTGFSTEPHLHFGVFTDCVGEVCRSIPTTFRNTAPNPTGLRQGGTYRAEPYAP